VCPERKIGFWNKIQSGVEGNRSPARRRMKNACGCGRNRVGDSQELGLHWRERKKREKVNCGYGKLTKRDKDE